MYSAYHSLEFSLAPIKQRNLRPNKHRNFVRLELVLPASCNLFQLTIALNIKSCDLSNAKALSDP